LLMVVCAPKCAEYLQLRLKLAVKLHLPPTRFVV